MGFGSGLLYWVSLFRAGRSLLSTTAEEGELGTHPWRGTGYGWTPSAVRPAFLSSQWWGGEGGLLPGLGETLD